jgi:hypothetical protein
VFTMPIVVFTMDRSRCSRCADPAVHVRPIWAFTMGRNPHTYRGRRRSKPGRFQLFGLTLFRMDRRGSGWLLYGLVRWMAGGLSHGYRPPTGTPRTRCEGAKLGGSGPCPGPGGDRECAKSPRFTTSATGSERPGIVAENARAPVRLGYLPTVRALVMGGTTRGRSRAKWARVRRGQAPAGVRDRGAVHGRRVSEGRPGPKPGHKRRPHHDDS